MGIGFAENSQLVSRIESQQYTYGKGCDVKCRIVLPENTGVCVKNDRNSKGSNQDRIKKRRGNARVFIPEFWNDKKGIKCHWKINQFHMFPRRLIYREKETDEIVSAAQIVDEM